MKANIVQVKGITFVGKADSNQWVPMDGPADFHGSNAATRPKELILLGLGGCTASDVIAILQKMRENVTRFEVDVDADLATEHPKVFTQIHIKYKFWGEDLKPANLEKAINLSQDKYCAVSAMLAKACPVTHSYEINPE